MASTSNAQYEQSQINSLEQQAKSEYAPAHQARAKPHSPAMTYGERGDVKGKVTQQAQKVATGLKMFAAKGWMK